MRRLGARSYYRFPLPRTREEQLEWTTLSAPDPSELAVVKTGSVEVSIHVAYDDGITATQIGNVTGLVLEDLRRRLIAELGE